MTEVSCAVIRNEELDVLVVQRGVKSDHPLKWEFPGGKVDQGESPEDSVIREVLEELGMKIIIAGTLQPVEYDYGIKQIRLIPFICDTLMEKPVLHEHAAYRWVNPDQLREIDFVEADIAVAMNYLTLSVRSTGTGSFVAEVPVERHPDAEVVSDDELKGMVTGLSGVGEIEWIAASASANSLLLRKLLDFSEGGDTRVVFRSSWALTKVCESSPDLLIPYLPEIVEKLIITGNESAERSFLKILQLTGTGSLDDKITGRLVDHCFNLLRSRESAIAVKVYSMDVLVDVVQRFPEVTSELVAVLGMMPGDVPAGIISKRRAVLRKLST